MKRLKFPAVAALAMLACTSQAWAQRYKVIEQPLSRDLSAGWTPRTTALNDLGGSTVNEYINTIAKAEVCDAATGECKRMPLLPHHGSNTSAHANGINDAGQVAGAAYDRGTFRAVLMKDGELVNLGALADEPGLMSSASSVSNLGTVAGYGQVAGGSWRAFIWKDGATTVLPTLGGDHGEASAVSDGGHVVGTSITASDARHAFLWSNGTITDLGALGGDYSVAYAVNRHGVVVGAAARPTGKRLRAFRWRDGAMEDLGALPTGDSAAALGINDHGEVVGVANIAPVTRHIDRAFLFDEQGMKDLNDLLRPADRKLYTIERADDINNRGDIAAQAVRKSDDRVVAVILKRID